MELFQEAICEAVNIAWLGFVSTRGCAWARLHGGYRSATITSAAASEALGEGKARQRGAIARQSQTPSKRPRITGAAHDHVHAS